MVNTPIPYAITYFSSFMVSLYIHIEFTNADPEILQFKRKRDGYVCKINIECVDIISYVDT